MATKTKTPQNNGAPAGTSAVTGGVFMIPRPNIQRIVVPIVGTTSLIVHAWSEKAKKQMRDKQTQKAKGPREAKDPQAEYQASLYVADAGWYGAPAAGFKAACVGACRLVDGLPMTLARRLLYIKADGRSTKQSNIELVRIQGEPEMREDFVRLDSGSADIRYRGEFREWEAELLVEFNGSMISAEQVVNLIAIAGYSEGVCEWRTSSPHSDTGDHGKWEVKKD